MIRQILRFALRVAIVAAILWAVRRILEPRGGQPAEAIAKGEAQIKSWVDDARKHVESAVADGRQAARDARRELEAAAGAALKDPEEEELRPDDPKI